ncbi:emerin (Emery-Dreifuss muscular dystrophy) [Trichomycterus rosablanca]|uniref:emerin (Emery-Dreifuss muscular dystrophy) n=1 Tax=Trichomycterus rosablanca TaxID=2290929 RepID=UPI002F355427
MSSLSSKSADELCKLLDEYGIKHGPIVDSTRKLYEKKLADAMSKNTKPSSDKTYYREEQEEVTYVTYSPTRQEGFGDVTKRSRPFEYADDKDKVNEPVTRYTTTNYQSATPSRSSAYTTKSSLQSASPGSSQTQARSEESKKSGVPLWLRVLVFVIVAAILYFVYISMESTAESPFDKIDA